MNQSKRQTPRIGAQPHLFCASSLAHGIRFALPWPIACDKNGAQASSVQVSANLQQLRTSKHNMLCSTLHPVAVVVSKRLVHPGLYPLARDTWATLHTAELRMYVKSSSINSNARCISCEWCFHITRRSVGHGSKHSHELETLDGSICVI